MELNQEYLNSLLAQIDTTNEHTQPLISSMILNFPPHLLNLISTVLKITEKLQNDKYADELAEILPASLFYEIYRLDTSLREINSINSIKNEAGGILFHKYNYKKIVTNYFDLYAEKVGFDFNAFGENFGKNGYSPFLLKIADELMKSGKLQKSYSNNSVLDLALIFKLKIIEDRYDELLNIYMLENSFTDIEEAIHSIIKETVESLSSANVQLDIFSFPYLDEISDLPKDVSDKYAKDLLSIHIEKIRRTKSKYKIPKIGKTEFNKKSFIWLGTEKQKSRAYKWLTQNDFIPKSLNYELFRIHFSTGKFHYKIKPIHWLKSLRSLVVLTELWGNQKKSKSLIDLGEINSLTAENFRDEMGNEFNLNTIRTLRGKYNQDEPGFDKTLAEIKPLLTYINESE